jgi:hypothetical protein
MSNPFELTRADVLRAAARLRWRRKMPKWTTIVEGRELPARPLVLEAAGVPPNDSTNSHQAVDILKRLGFETRYRRDSAETTVLESESEPEGMEPSMEPAVGLNSILQIVSAASEEVPAKAWDRLPADFSKNLDHYLYGTQKTEE